MTYATKKKLATILMKHQELDIELLQEKIRERKNSLQHSRGVNKMMGDNGMLRYQSR